MATKYAFAKSLKEVRFLFCQTSQHSAATRYVFTHSNSNPLWSHGGWPTHLKPGHPMFYVSSGEGERMIWKWNRQTRGRIVCQINDLVTNGLPVRFGLAQGLPHAHIPDHEEAQPLAAHHAARGSRHPAQGVREV
jgi:hypothetical protein